ncbi:MAG TPA: Uma2 family endonuclease [Saprospiraceae bacterium]|nr:Uma2 family endonuclease [Saprospiraceae bacterium]HMQ84491.1 Uma2 family endonuclease [Saprospiraceae bacterium]
MDTSNKNMAIKEGSDNPLAEIKPPRLPKQYTLGEYLRREESGQEKHEFINGIIAPIPMAKGPHNIITMNVGSALKQVLKANPKKYIVFSNSQKIYLPELNIGLYPDVLVVCEQPVYWDEGELLLTNPLLIVEVLSQSTRHYDRGNKFSYYKRLPSFQEYVLIAQNHCEVETWYREEPDLWRTNTVKDRTSTLPLRSVDCALQMADIYEHVIVKST